jgi:hypothetical protein
MIIAVATGGGRPSGRRPQTNDADKPTDAIERRLRRAEWPVDLSPPIDPERYVPSTRARFHNGESCACDALGYNSRSERSGSLSPFPRSSSGGGIPVSEHTAGFIWATARGDRFSKSSD